MKKLIAILFACLCALPLSSCNESMSTAGEGIEGGNRFTSKAIVQCAVITDEATGVQYLYVWGDRKAGLTVLLDSDGKPFVRNVD